MTTVKTNKTIDTFKPVLRQKDMDRDMYNEIEKLAKECVESPKEKFKNENEIANYMKKFLEEKYKDKDLCWHVIITFKEKVMCYLYVGQIGFLIFATPDV